MDGKAIEQIRNSLLDRWRAIGKNLNQGRDLDAMDNGPQAEIIDIAQSLEQIGRDMSLAEQERKELMAIERALAKMASGNFGSCEECGEEIPPKRLMVLPEARLCANCQAVSERQTARNRVV